MKQVVFAIALLAMASLTGCLNTDDTTKDNTIEPTGQSGGYSPPDKANITVSKNGGTWVAKDGNRITTSCMGVSSGYQKNIVIFDSDDRIIYLANSWTDYGASDCGSYQIVVDVTLGPEPVKVGLTRSILDANYDYATTTNGYYWIVTF